MQPDAGRYHHTAPMMSVMVILILPAIGLWWPVAVDSRLQSYSRLIRQRKGRQRAFKTGVSGSSLTQSTAATLTV